VAIGRLISVAAAALCPAVAGALGGCAALERQQAADTEKLLAVAGFRRFPAASDNRDVIQLPRDIVVRRKGANGLYIYADPRVCRCVYVGGPEAYAKYREFAVSEAITADMSIAAPNSASTNGPAWAIWDPHWAPTDAWDDPAPPPVAAD
jgi:hypothetical protein